MTFLTEEEAGADRGTFSDKYKTKRDSEHSVTNPEDNRADILIEDVEVKPFRGGMISTNLSHLIPDLI